MGSGSQLSDFPDSVAACFVLRSRMLPRSTLDPILQRRCAMDVPEEQSRCPNTADGLHVISRGSIMSDTGPDGCGFPVDLCCEMCDLPGSAYVENEQIVWHDE